MTSHHRLLYIDYGELRSTVFNKHIYTFCDYIQIKTNSHNVAFISIYAKYYEHIRMIETETIRDFSFHERE